MAEAAFSAEGMMRAIQALQKQNLEFEARIEQLTRQMEGSTQGGLACGPHSRNIQPVEMTQTFDYANLFENCTSAPTLGVDRGRINMSACEEVPEGASEKGVEVELEEKADSELETKSPQQESSSSGFKGMLAWAKEQGNNHCKTTTEVEDSVWDTSFFIGGSGELGIVSNIWTGAILLLNIVMQLTFAILVSRLHCAASSDAIQGCCICLLASLRPHTKLTLTKPQLLY